MILIFQHFEQAINFRLYKIHFSEKLIISILITS